MGKQAIVMSGLPASGKSTIGRALSEALSIPILDKDDFLERLYDQRGVGDRDWRRQLSRESDDLFRQEAIKRPEAVLVSHWRPRSTTADTGTPTDWLSETFKQIVEVHCACSPELAAQRFVERKRHAGHLDCFLSVSEVEMRMRDLVAGYPLKIGQLLEVGDSINVPDLAHRIRGLMAI
jgi:adenylylsulfate kinase-like enzyme